MHVVSPGNDIVGRSVDYILERQRRHMARVPGIRYLNQRIFAQHVSVSECTFPVGRFSIGSIPISCRNPCGRNACPCNLCYKRLRTVFYKYSTRLFKPQLSLSFPHPWLIQSVFPYLALYFSQLLVWSLCGWSCPFIRKLEHPLTNCTKLNQPMTEHLPGQLINIVLTHVNISAPIPTTPTLPTSPESCWNGSGNSSGQWNWFIFDAPWWSNPDNWWVLHVLDSN